MMLARVTGTIVATQKNQHLRDRKLLVVQQVTLDGVAQGKDLLAVDSVDAGVGDLVLVLQEGQGAAQITRDNEMPIHSIVVAVVDGFDVALKE